MNKRIELLRIINNIVIAFCFQTVGIIALGGEISNELIFGALSLAAFVIISEIVQYFIKNLIIYVAFHIGAVYLCYELSMGISGVLGTTEYSFLIHIFRLFMMIVMAILAVYVRVRETLVFYPEISEAAFFIILMLTCVIAERRDGVIYVLFGEMVWAILAVLYYNARQILNAIAPYKNKMSVPYEAVKRNNGRMVVISATIVLVSMFICSLLDYGKEVLAALHFVTYKFFRWFFSLFHFKEIKETEPLEQVSGIGQMEGLLPENYEDDSIIHTIWQILFWVIAAVVIAAIIVVMIKGLREFYKRFNGSRIGIKDKLLKDEVEYLNPLSFGEKAGGAGEKLGFRERFSYEGRVRLIFQKYIKSGKGYKDVRLSQTPCELEETSSGRISEAYKVYEKARYSGHDITARDVSKIKEAVKR